MTDETEPDVNAADAPEGDPETLAPRHPPTRAKPAKGTRAGKATAPATGTAPTERDAATGLFVTKMTRDVVEAIVDLIEKQAAPETACILAGVHVRTFRQWLADGRAWLDDHDADEIPSPAAVFTTRVERALEQAKHALVTRVVAAEDWRASLAILERRHPREFARRDRIDIGNPDGEEFRLAGRDLSALSPDQLRALREILLVLAQSERGADVIDLPTRRMLNPTKEDTP